MDGKQHEEDCLEPREQESLESTTCSNRSSDHDEKEISEPTSLSSCTLAASCDSLAFLDYKLPPLGCSAGRVLQHCKQVMQSLFSKHEPMTFKFGYTHCPEWRWSNQLYGYETRDFNKFTNMVILFQSTECYSPGMLEAALIDLYRSTWSYKHVYLFSFVLNSVIYQDPLIPVHPRNQSKVNFFFWFRP